jgi:hypothetical protein
MTSNIVTAAVLAVCSAVSLAQTVAAPTPPAPTPQEQPGAAPVSAAPGREGLADLNAMTFDCPKAALNAAAREASAVQSQGTYQFAYFKIVSDSHHAAYEVHFKSNYPGEKDLNYCVALYCQQGWDPKSAKPAVTLMGGERQPRGAAGVAAHAGMGYGADCAVKPAPVKRRVKR